MSAPPEPSVKGTLLLARLEFLRSLGSGMLDGVVARLSPEDGARLRSILLPSSWYPLGLLRRLEAAMVAAMGLSGRPDLFLAIGRTAAARNLAGAQKPYVRPGDAHFLLQHTPQIYASYFNFGSRSYERIGPHAAVVRTTKPFEGAQVEECSITIGWLARGIELSGGHEVRVVETQCGFAGAPCCEFRCEWSPTAAPRAPATREPPSAGQPAARAAAASESRTAG